MVRFPGCAGMLTMLTMLTVLCAACGATGSRDARRPEQVILVTIDTLRADRLGCYGPSSVGTPALDAFAGESVVYEDVTSPAPITLVSHATILTGLTPPAHGVRTNGSFRLPPEVETLPERLKTRGFQTAAFIGAFVLHHEFGLDQGFDTYDDELPRHPKNRKFDFDERRAGEVLAQAAEWAVARDRKPFFLWAHLFDPHAPYDPPPPFDARFADRPYDGEVAYVDSELGIFFARLRRAGILDRALVVVTADHGEALGEHGEKTHGLFLYQSTLRVPLIVRPPGGASHPSRVRETVGLVDIAPSILAAVGGAAGSPMEGHTLPGFPGVRGDESRSAAAAERPGYYIENLLPFYSYGWAGIRGYRAGSRKLISAVRRELYDIAADPAEENDLGTKSAEAVTELLAKIDHATGSAEALLTGSADNPDISEEARVRLASLGYVGASVTGRRPSWGTGTDPREMLDFFDGVDRSKRLLADGEREEAIGILEKLVARGPPSLAVLDLLGQALMEQGDLDAAISVLLDAKKVDPGDYEVRRRLAEGYYGKGNYEAALAEARGALGLNAKNAESRSILGATLSRLGRPEEAIASFREAIAERPNEPALEYNLGLALESASRPADAEKAYRSAIELDPESAEARIALANLLVARDRLREADAQLEAAVRVDPQNLVGLEQLGIVRARLGDEKGALEQFDRVITLAPHRPEAFYDRALVLERVGRRAEAAAAFRAFLSRWKGDPSKANDAREHLRRLGS